MHKSGIYLIKNKINGKIYIGCSKDIKYRWKSHCKILKNRKSLINSAIQKYGKDSFEFIILLECPNICFDYWEKFYINEFKTMVPSGYNLTSGGEVKKIFSEESKLKISNSNKGRIIGEYCRKRASEANIGNSYAKGYAHTEDWKEEQSKRLKGVPKTKEHNEKNRLAKLGKKLSEETKKKIGESSKNRIITQEARLNMSKAQIGRKHTEETKLKIRESNKKRRRII